MLNCVLCLNLLRENNSVNVNDQQDDCTTVADIIKQHFWFSHVSLKKVAKIFLKFRNIFVSILF